MANGHSGHLGKVYGAAGPEEIAAAYDDWAAGYDAEMARSGYRHPSIAIALLARHLTKGAGPILDAGVGTGLAGPWFGILGWPEVWGMDISEGMLAEAAKKGAYARLMQGRLGAPLAFSDAQFAAVVCTGVFTTGHAGPEALPELIRITRPSGILVLTVKESLWQSSFASWIADAEDLAVVEMTEPYVSMPGEQATSPSRAIALRRI